MLSHDHLTVTGCNRHEGSGTLAVRTPAPLDKRRVRRPVVNDEKSVSGHAVIPGEETAISHRRPHVNPENSRCRNAKAPSRSQLNLRLRLRANLRANRNDEP